LLADGEYNVMVAVKGPDCCGGGLEEGSGPRKIWCRSIIRGSRRRGLVNINFGGPVRADKEKKGRRGEKEKRRDTVSA